MNARRVGDSSARKSLFLPADAPGNATPAAVLNGYQMFHSCRALKLHSTVARWVPTTRFVAPLLDLQWKPGSHKNQNGNEPNRVKFLS